MIKGCNDFPTELQPQALEDGGRHRARLHDARDGHAQREGIRGRQRGTEDHELGWVDSQPIVIYVWLC